jgi:hypothetical protein
MTLRGQAPFGARDSPQWPDSPGISLAGSRPAAAGAAIAGFPWPCWSLQQAQPIGPIYGDMEPINFCRKTETEYTVENVEASG